ncbi:unnamed protein product [Kuraishia capsulata CBS 1993]|uniref:Ammonia transport outward protein 2 n=1 Tax=Kuraishia capsulata CBS 1993 TaxID=1382522 RepID=W6MQ16_9ASCO|nr:uncharacterized protein KUCA_T00003305001 [Kuraishia capsulata CBS 1993]CDK27327.1 unnamed protein product [Kuraishia capsulata CBS 1993]
MPDDIEKQLQNDDHSSDTNFGEHVVAKIHTSDDGEFVHFGNQKFYRRDLLQAFGGTLNPGLSAPSTHKFGNPAPLGLSAFALTTFVLSLINAKAMGVSTPNVVIGLSMFYGGLVQLLAGMWELALENTFGALALGSFGGFWMSFGAIFIPWFNIASAYEDPTELDNALGFYLLGWTIFTFMLCLVTVKSTVPFFGLFVFLDITFLLLSLGYLAPSVGCTRAGGVFGVITAFIAWYNAYAGVANPQNAYLTIKPFNLPKFGKDS